MQVNVPALLLPLQGSINKDMIHACYEKPKTIAPGFYALDQKPTFQGQAPNAFSTWGDKQLVYPESSRNRGSEGQFRLKFTIEKSGKLGDISIVKSSGNPLLDAEAFRVVSSSPD